MINPKSATKILKLAINLDVYITKVFSTLLKAIVAKAIKLYLPPYSSHRILIGPFVNQPYNSL